jgi:calpain-7
MEFMLEKPKMICLISAYTVTQSVITDCSFVASLIVAAMYERRHNKQLITNIIYPQDKHGKPIVSKGGKYMIRLFFNG